MKDLVCRYKTMTGHLVERKGGWDAHGPPPSSSKLKKPSDWTQKKKLNSTASRSSSKKCRDSVLTYEQDWKKVSERIGFWVDMEKPYITYSNEYIRIALVGSQADVEQGAALRGA